MPRADRRGLGGIIELVLYSTYFSYDVTSRTGPYKISPKVYGTNVLVVFITLLLCTHSLGVIYTERMPMPGYVFRDGQPIPDSELKEQNEGVQPGSSMDMTRVSTPTSSAVDTPSSSATDGDHPTDSHALANADHDEKGAAQVNEEDKVKNLGWNEHPKEIPDLVGGLDNEELWTLIRRFNKQMYHVKATTAPLLGGLDLNIADEDEFSPDKLRANIERLYMTVIIGLMGFGKHIARLRSWREPRRTAAFATVSRRCFRCTCPKIVLWLTSSPGICTCLDSQSFTSNIPSDANCPNRLSSFAFDPFPSSASCLGRFEYWRRAVSQSWSTWKSR